MANPFANVNLLERPWMSLCEVDPSLIDHWHHIFLSAGLNTESPKLNVRTQIQPTDQMKRLIQVVTDVFSRIKRAIGIPHVFILADQQGIALHVSGSTEIINSLKEHNIGLGTPFALEYAGINGIPLPCILKILSLYRVRSIVSTFSRIGVVFVVPFEWIKRYAVTLTFLFKRVMM